MKLYVSMKTPDAISYAIREAIHDENLMREADGTKPMDEEEEYEMREKLENACNKWFSFGECTCVVIDVEEETATVSKPGY